MNLLCRLGIHSYVRTPLPSSHPAGDRDTNKVCRRCGKHFRGFLAQDQSQWWGEVNGITVGELRAALDEVPDDVEVEVGSNALLGGGWAGADAAFLTTKRVALATESPQTVPVFRIGGRANAQGTGWMPGMGT